MVRILPIDWVNYTPVNKIAKLFVQLRSTKENTLMSNISTPDLTDAHPETAALELQFTNFGAHKQFGGPVVTIKCHEDNSLVKQCVGEPGEGRVIVVDGGGSLGLELDIESTTKVKKGLCILMLMGMSLVGAAAMKSSENI